MSDKASKPLKLAQLPQRTPIKLTISLDPSTHSALEEYAGLYDRTYGAPEPIADLIPYMLKSFIESDKVFARAKRVRSKRLTNRTEGE